MSDIIEQLLRAQRAAFTACLKEAVELDDVWQAVARARADMDTAASAQLNRDELISLHGQLLTQSDALIRAAVASVVAQQIARVTELAQRDAVTGIGNRAAFDARLRAEMMRARRYGRSLALALLDLDDFKTINDRAGHPAGDRVLASVARGLQSSLRETDVVFRYGGDEFAVLSPETSAAAFAAAWQRVAQTWQAGNNERFKATISCGVASFPQDATDETELLRVADERLYASKRARRTGNKQ